MSNSPTNVDQFVDAYVEANAWQDGRDPETCRENAQKYAVSLFGEAVDRKGWFDWLDKPPEEATPDDARGFMAYLQEEGLSASTRMQARSGISQWYQLMDIEAPNPVEGLDASWRVTSEKEQATGEKRSHPTREDIEAMIDSAPEPTLQSELIIQMLYQTGVRRMELATIKIDHIDREARRIRVYGDKTNEWRTVAYQPTLDTPLTLWIDGARRGVAGYTEDNPYLFPTMTMQGHKDHISGQTIRETVVKAAKNAGVQGTYGRDVNGQNQHTITPHSLRHAFAVHSAENGVPAPHLKEVLGHHSLDVTQIYADIAGDDAADLLAERGPSV